MKFRHFLLTGDSMVSVGAMLAHGYNLGVIEGEVLGLPPLGAAAVDEDEEA